MDDISAQEFVRRLNKNGKKKETNLQKRVQAYLVSLGAYEFKVHGSIYMKAGIPDIISCYKGLFIAIECKVDKNKMSEVQKAHKEMIERAGGIHICAYNLDDVKKVLEDL